jgi:CelD/BcsL family acetyltransferase involved in cellulose biosynthesis
MTSFGNATAAIASVRRVAAADRHSAMRIEVELRPLSELAAIAEDWRLLAARALEQNVFYDPGFALAAAPVMGADVRAGLIWSRAPRELVGFFPVRIDRCRYGIPFALLVGWTHPYAPLGTPLVDRDLAEPVIAAWLDHVTNDAALPNLMLMPMVAQTGAFAKTLADLLARRGCQATSFDRHQRALLLPGENRAGYFQRSLSGKRLRDMRRRERRLQERGTLALEQAKDGETLASALEDFLALEAAGWKGRAGTAASQNQGERDFIERAVTALGRDDKVLIHRLRAGGKVIAAAIALKSGDTAWGWKVSYDEAYAEYSPGVLAVAGLTEALLADAAIAQADSCATAGDPMASTLWSERLTMADWLFATTARANFSFRLAARLETWRRSAIAAAKSARDHLRRH